jgi:plastocyanin domain-containing protein
MKNIYFSIVVVAVLIGGVSLLTRNNNSEQMMSEIANNVFMEGETQIVEITAKAGYSPRQSFAKAGLPTIIRFQTNGLFDCSAQVRIRELNINQVLPNKGTFDVDAGVRKAGTLKGSCGMGMYPFEIVFK